MRSLKIRNNENGVLQELTVKTKIVNIFIAKTVKRKLIKFNKFSS